MTDNLIIIKITSLNTSLSSYTPLNSVMLKGLHSSVGSASDLQSRGPGLKTASGHGVNMK